MHHSMYKPYREPVIAELMQNNFFNDESWTGLPPTIYSIPVVNPPSISLRKKAIVLSTSHKITVGL